MLFHDLDEELQKTLSNAIRNYFAVRPEDIHDTHSILKCPCNTLKLKWASMRYLQKYDSTSYFIHCMKCTNTGQLKDTPEEAIQAWNTEVTLLNC